MSEAINRRKVQVVARQLEDVEVSFVSLVRNAATRIPFRILKSEKNPMSINLSNLFFQKTDEVVTEPTVIGVAVSKNVDIEALQPLLVEAGLEFPVVTELEEGAVLKADEAELLEDASYIKVHDEVAVVVKAMQAWPDSVDFAENQKATGFFPGVRMAGDILMATIENIAYSDMDQGGTVEAIEKACGDHKKYVMGLLKAVPAQVFKAEEIREVPMKKEDKADAEDKAEVVENAEDGKLVDAQKCEHCSEVDAADPDTPVEKADADAPKDADVSLEGDLEVVEKAEGSENVSDDTGAANVTEADAVVEKAEAEGVAVAKQMDEVMALLKAQTEALQGLTGLKDTVESLSSTVEGLSEDVANVQKTAGEAAAAINGTVYHNSADDSNPKAPSKVVKSEDDEGFWDSAMNFGGRL